MAKPAVSGPLSESEGGRFWSKVALPNEQGCMLWLGYVDGYGYGVFSRKGWRGRAHRVSYETLVSLVPDGLVIDHLCRVRHCVTPDHLEAVTQAENVRRGEAGANQRAKTHCPSGHPYSGENLKLTPRGRWCRKCHRRDDQRRYRERRSA